MIYKLFFFACLIVWAISIIEVVGSYFLTKRYHEFCSTVNMMFSFVVPFTAPMFALAIFDNANEMYNTRQRNTYHEDESLYAFVLHGFKSIDQWAGKKRQ